MKIQLINEIQDGYSTIEQICTNRGVPKSEVYHYLNLTDDDLCDYNSFGEKELYLAAGHLRTALEADQKIFIQVDSDCDGYTSAAILINYLYSIKPEWAKANIYWRVHEDKSHGLIASTVPEDVSLIIIPDAGTNDTSQCEEVGVPVIILDHHEAEKANPNAIIINNHTSDYPNKELSGAGVVYKFCEYLDEKYFHTEQVEKLLDLVALGNTADMMSLTSYETRRLITKGLENINNPFFYYMCQKNAFSLGSQITSWGIAFYVAPFVNAMTRSGTTEEKELLFKSMLTMEAFEEVPSTKRGCKGQFEKLVEQAVRTCTNVKNRQTKAQDEGMAKIENMIVRNDMLKNKVLLFPLAAGAVPKNIAGLIGNKLMAKYQRPVCVLTEGVDKEGNTIYAGSARGCDIVGINEFKDMCVATGVTSWVAGHQGAFGTCMLASDIPTFMDKMNNEILKDTSTEPVFFVDYLFDAATPISGKAILDIAELGHLWGKDFREALVAVKNVKVTAADITFMGKTKKDTMKIVVDEIPMIKFRCDEEEIETFTLGEFDELELSIVGKCNANEWGGRVTPQILIEEYEIVDTKVVYNF